MTKVFRTATTGLAMACLLIGLTASAQGFMSLSPWQPGIPERLIQLKGTVVCTDCSLPEACRLQHDPYGNHLYYVTSPQGPLVLNLQAVSSPRWFADVTVPQFSLRGEEELLQPLHAPEIQAKNIEVTGLLTTPRTLEVQAVVIHAGPLHPLDVSEAQTRQ